MAVETRLMNVPNTEPEHPMEAEFGDNISTPAPKLKHEPNSFFVSTNLSMLHGRINLVSDVFC